VQPVRALNIPAGVAWTPRGAARCERAGFASVECRRRGRVDAAGRSLLRACRVCERGVSAPGSRRRRAAQPAAGVPDSGAWSVGAEFAATPQGKPAANERARVDRPRSVLLGGRLHCALRGAVLAEAALDLDLL